MYSGQFCAREDDSETAMCLDLLQQAPYRLKMEIHCCKPTYRPRCATGVDNMRTPSDATCTRLFLPSCSGKVGAVPFFELPWSGLTSLLHHLYEFFQVYTAFTLVVQMLNHALDFLVCHGPLFLDIGS